MKNAPQIIAIGSALLLWTVGAQAQGSGTPPTAKEEADEEVLYNIFQEASKDYYSKSYENAAEGFLNFLQQSPMTNEKFGWAEFGLAEALHQLGYHHAASDYYRRVVKDRRAPEILAQAVQVLEEYAQHEYDDPEWVAEDIIFGEELGALPPNLQAFVHFEQARVCLKKGLIRWAETHLQALPKTSPYYYRGRYLWSLYQLTSEDSAVSAAAILDLETLAADPQAPAVVRDKAHVSLGEIYYEKKDFSKAWSRFTAAGRSAENYSLFVAKSWSQYFLQDYRKTGGLLMALESPEYRQLFVPEKYILRGLVYKNLCQYDAGRQVTQRFRLRYQGAHQAILNRANWRADPQLQQAALLDPYLAAKHRTRNDIRGEILRSGRLSGALEKHVTFLDQQRLIRLDWEINQALDEVLPKTAQSLLDALEQMNLLDYEIGLSQNDKIRDEDTVGAKRIRQIELPAVTQNVYYWFDGEFWNDEIHDYQFYIEDKCLDRAGGEATW